MNMKILRMNIDIAKAISSWKYEELYSIYSFDGSENCIDELMDGSYYYVLNEFGELAGYFCYGRSACVPAGFGAQVYNRNDVVDIGLGMRPDLCGKKMGLSFLKAGLDYAKELYNNDKFRLTVAVFNKRAIKLYEKAGFIKEKTFVKESEMGIIEFQTMIRDND